jgi:hypothetical protein
MKPLTFEALDDFRRFPRQMLLLDNSKVTLRYIRRLLARGCNNIRTKHGLSLPPELWDIILDFASVGGSFCLVEAQELITCPTRTLLRCVKKRLMDVALNREPAALGRYVEDLDDVEAVEACLRDSINVGDNRLDKLIRIEKILPPNDGTFYFFLDPNRPEESHFLYYEIDIPDVISRIEGGECKCCWTTRFICPCYDHGEIAGGLSANFGLYSNSCVDITCPVCMGVDFSQMHWFDLVRKIPREELEDVENQRFNRICGRLRELGYEADMKQEGMLRAIRRPPPLGPDDGVAFPELEDSDSD